MASLTEYIKSKFKPDLHFGRTHTPAKLHVCISKGSTAMLAG